MTVSSTTTKNSYSANGSLTAFTYTFPINSTAELKVIERASSGTETVKTLDSHYSISDNGAAGGTVTFGSAPANGVTVVLLRDTSLTQETDYIANDPFPAETHESALDKLTLQQQELQEELDRSIKLSRTNTMTSTEFTVDSTARANKMLGFDSSGELSVTQEIGTNRGNWAASTSYEVRDIIKDTSNNNIYMAKTAHTSSGSQPISSNTDVAKWDLLVDAATSTTNATNAASSATAAASSATAAASSATTASTQASNASTSASTATTKASEATTAKNAAVTAQQAAEAALDTFDDRFLGAKSSNPTVDNDGNALIDGALYFDTTNDLMKVYNLANTTWYQLALTGTNQTNVNTVAAAISNVNTVAGANSNITTLAGLNSEISALNGISAAISGVNTISAAVSAVNSNATNINAVNSNATNINAVAGAATNINNVGGSIANVNSVATNLAAVNNFADQYRIASSAPTSSLNVGDLYFDTTANELKVYKSSGWAAAGSTVNGTSQRYTYNISGTPSSVTGSDANGNTLAYDAGFADVYVNGVRMSSADITITSGTSVVFASALADGDVVDVVGYGTFNVASINAANIDSGNLNIARIADDAITNAKLANESITINGSAVVLGGSVTVGETKPTITGVSPTVIENTQTTITITGTGFVRMPVVTAINNSTGARVVADEVSFSSATSITAKFTISVDGTYLLYLENPDGNAVQVATGSAQVITVSDAPAWTTSAGSLGTFAAGSSFGTINLTATDSTSMSKTSGTFPGGMTLNSGGSGTSTLTGTESGATAETTYNFTIRATDAEGQTADRAFSITITVGINNSGQFN